MFRNATRLLSLGLLLLGPTGAVFALDVTQTQPLPAAGSPSTGTVATGGAVTTASQADTGGLVSELSDLKRYFTITADLREEYDDNVNTTDVNKISSFEEIISPSILFSYPMDNSTFDARYTFGLTYYDRKAAGNTTYDQDHDVVLRYNHAFSDRFNLDLRDDGGYHEDPSLLEALGTVNREGGYYSNVFTAEFTAQWTPLFGTVTSYSNNFIEYENQTVGDGQDSDENTLSQDFRFAFWPTVTFAVGGIYDEISYFDTNRGFNNYTGNTGLDWQALPSLSLGFRIGGSVTTTDDGPTSESPYASANINWQLGERSRFIGSYVHSVTPTDIVFAQGQESDRFTANFIYNITDRITVNLEGIYTYSDYTTELLTNGSGSSFTENVVGVNTGLTYHYSQYIDFEGGYILSDVSSQEAGRNYTRNQFYVGIRGTY